MSVVMDPDWDNKAVIIDCSKSKKVKQKELEKYAAYAVRRQMKEEKFGETTPQAPPAGTKEADTNKLGRIRSIVPQIELKQELGIVGKYRPTMWGELKPPALGGTVVPVNDYTNHLVDPDYVIVEHQKLVGMIKQWKMIVLEVIKDMEDEWEYSWRAFTNQRNWIKNNIDTIMFGVSKFKLISVGLLNRDAVIKLVDGVDDEEKADFIINMAKCKSCEIGLVRHDDLNNCSVVTIFDEDTKNKVAYGKINVEDLNPTARKKRKW